MVSEPDILNARILIVDDQDANIALLEQILRGAGYVSVSATKDANAVCTLHSTNRYDLILLDLQMPGMDGFRVMEGLRKIEAGGYVPVLVITAQPSHKLRALNSGARDFISKPFEIAEVLIRVHNLIEVRLLHLDGTVANVARLEKAQRIAGLGDWEYDFSRDGRLRWSEGVYSILGLSRAEFPPSSETFYSLVHPEDLEFVHQEKGAAAKGARRVEFEHRIIRPGGEIRHIRQIAEMTYDDQGQPTMESGTIQDLTEQKKMEAQFMRAQRMESIGTLAGGIAHDLNNVLAPILMAIELLKQDDANDPRRSDILETIHVSCRRGADLVRQVLSFARGDDHQRVSMRLERLIGEVEAIITHTFPRNIRISNHISGGLWPITGDPTQLHQVLLNLVVNARDAMPHGGTLALNASNANVDRQFAATSHGAKPGAYVLLEVADSGCGIPPEVRDRIFEAFFTTKEVGKGTGLGLATVQTVVKNHGGFLNVESEIDRGSNFKVYLPADSVNEKAVTEHPFQGSVPRGRNELVLVVDDEASIRDITRQTLETFGYRVITANDGAAAVAIYAKRVREVALVITDMIMPIMDGAATIHVLKCINPSVRIIAASGLELAENMAKAAGAGVLDFLQKPYTARALAERVRAVIDRPEPPPMNRTSIRVAGRFDQGTASTFNGASLQSER